MKKLFSLVVALSLVISSTVSAYAISELTTTSSSNCKSFSHLKSTDSQVQEDISAFISVGIEEQLITSAEIEDDSIKYVNMKLHILMVSLTMPPSKETAPEIW